jgi:hypothetical protein
LQLSIAPPSPVGIFCIYIIVIKLGCILLSSHLATQDGPKSNREIELMSVVLAISASKATTSLATKAFCNKQF